MHNKIMSDAVTSTVTALGVGSASGIVSDITGAIVTALITAVVVPVIRIGWSKFKTYLKEKKGLSDREIFLLDGIFSHIKRLSKEELQARLETETNPNLRELIEAVLKETE